jgi:pyruvate-formate lyase
VKRWLAFLSTLLVTALVGYSQTELPENDDYQSFEVEPPILMPNRQVQPEKSATTSTGPSRDPAEVEKQVERAKRTASEAVQLFKKGVLSKMEAELRALRVVRLQSDLENSRLERVKAEFAIQQTRYEMGKIPKDVFAAAASALEVARERADAAATARERAEIAAAETNLRRQQKLAALGSARSSDVARAEQKLADLKAAKN